MAKVQRMRVESIYRSKEEKELAEILQWKIAQMICKKPDKTGIQFRMSTNNRRP